MLQTTNYDLEANLKEARQGSILNMLFAAQKYLLVANDQEDQQKKWLYKHRSFIWLKRLLCARPLPADKAEKIDRYKAHALETLAEYYYSGTGTPKDIQQAVEFAKMACTQGMFRITYKMATGLFTGVGLPQGIQKNPAIAIDLCQFAMSHINKAGDEGSGEYRHRIENLWSILSSIDTYYVECKTEEDNRAWLAHCASKYVRPPQAVYEIGDGTLPHRL